MTTLLAEEASTLTMGQPMGVHSPHQVQFVLEMKEDKKLIAGGILQYQAPLLDTTEITSYLNAYFRDPQSCMRTSLFRNNQ